MERICCHTRSIAGAQGALVGGAANALLLDAERKQFDNPEVKNWLDSLMDVVYPKREVKLDGSSNLIMNCGQNVFVYGSLMADEVVGVLLNRVPPSTPATLHGFHRFKVKGRVYPAILPLDNKKVIGRVLRGISRPELDILDEFEDVEYNRTDAEVLLIDSSEKLQVYTYVWSDHNDPNLYGEWDFEETMLPFLLFISQIPS